MGLNPELGKTFHTKSLLKGEGSKPQWFANLLLGPAAPGSIPSVPKKKFRGKFNETGQRLDIVDRTHVVPVLQKISVEDGVGCWDSSREVQGTALRERERK